MTIFSWVKTDLGVSWKGSLIEFLNWIYQMLEVEIRVEILREGIGFLDKPSSWHYSDIVLDF
jgi:hypothetical protein